MPDYSDFKVFDCLFCVSVRESDKYSPRAIRCVFLGYPHVHKGFKLLDLTNHKQFISMNVIFHEIVFSFLDKSDTAPPPDFYHLQNCLHFDTSMQLPIHLFPVLLIFLLIMILPIWLIVIL